jgi:hypothetical protein
VAGFLLECVAGFVGIRTGALEALHLALTPPGRLMRIPGSFFHRPLMADFVEKPRLLAATVSVGEAVSRGKEVRSASCGEDRFREGDDLRQLPQILGCGGQ